MSNRLTQIFVRIVVAASLIASCGVHAADVPPAPAVTYGANPAAAHEFTFNGNRFYYETYGAGEPLLLIHGNGASIATFDKQIGEFSQHYQVIAMDSRGQGKSELGTKHLNYEQMADDSNALLDHLKLDHVKVLGWSDGGIIGLLLAIHHPDKVGMLAVMGANLNPEAAQQWALDGLARYRKQLNEKLVAATASGADTAQINLELQMSDLLQRQPNIPAAELSRVQVPTLVMAGDRDVIRNAHTLLMFESLPKAQLEIFHGATHMIPTQDPERFNKTVLDFFGKPFSMPDTRDMHWFD